jgi:hypothetical protein
MPRRATFRGVQPGIEPDPGILLGGLAKEVGGLIVVDGKIIRIPSRSPLQQILVQLAAIQTSDMITTVTSRDAARQSALTAIAGHVEAQLGSVRVYRQPAPRQSSDDIDAPDGQHYD